MDKTLFRRCLVFAAIGAASVVLTACGGGAGGEETSADEPLARTTTTDEAEWAVAVEAQRPGDLAAADDGAASFDQQ